MDKHTNQVNVPDAQREVRQPRSGGWLAAGLLVVLVAVVFYPVLGFEFVDFDTYEQVTFNPNIRGLSWDNVKYILTSRCITSYYPFRTLSYALNYELFGLNAGGFKLVNVLIHLTNAMLVFWLARRLLSAPGTDRSSDNSGWDVALAFVAGAVFAVHPVVVEPVVWIPGREELLMTLGALGAIHFHIGARRISESGGSRQAVLACHLGAVMCCAAACLSNAVAAIIPALAATWDLLTLRQRRWTRMALGTAPMWGIAVATFVTKTCGEPEPIVSLVHMTVQGRIMIGLSALWLNMKSLVWPDNLCLYYDWIYPSGCLDHRVLLGTALLLLGLVGLWWLRRRPFILFGYVWFGLTLAPTLQLISHHIHRADRFLYLPIAGLFVAAALILRLVIRQTGHRAVRIGIALSLVAVVIALAVRSSYQVPIWRTSLGVWQHCLALNPNNARAHDVVGDHFHRRDEISKAIEHYETVLRLRPYAVETLETYGHGLSSWDPEYRDYGRAVELVKRAFEVTRGRSDMIRTNLANLHAKYAYYLQEQGEYSRALREYEDCLKVDGTYGEAAFNLALLLATCPDARLRDPERAVEVAEMAQSVSPVSDLNHYLILAEVYAQVGRYGAALIATSSAMDLARQQGDEAVSANLQKQMMTYEGLVQPRQKKRSRTLPPEVENQKQGRSF